MHVWRLVCSWLTVCYTHINTVTCAAHVPCMNCISFCAFHLSKLSGVFLFKLRKAIISFVMSVGLSVRVEHLGPDWTDFPKKFESWVFFENLSRKFKFHSYLTRITGTLHEDVCVFMIVSRWILLRMRNISEKSCRENRIIHFMSCTFFPKIVPLMR
jgi:hypothetical protein